MSQSDRFNWRSPSARLLAVAGALCACSGPSGTANDRTGYIKPVWSCEYTNQRVDLINGVLRALPKGMGRGSFIWEPTRYPQINGGATGSNSVLFDNTGGNGGHYTTNAAIAHYATLAKSYGLPVPSGTCRSN